MADTDALEIHVVAHTHWDREWYRAAGRFRQRLVALIDELLDDPPPFGESFLLDGQAILLDDYFAVRPERRGEVAALLRERQLEAGPWYVLADELIPSGEALVRNLLAGHRALHALGADPPPVLYCPDSFGHPGVLPMLAREFGLSLIIVWRGYGGQRWPRGDTVDWRAADGSSVLLHHLPPDGYEFGSSLPTSESAARARWATMRGVLARRSTLGVLLVQNGADHHARQRESREAIDALEKVAKPATLVRSSLSKFAHALLERAQSRSLPAVTGELRDSYGYTWALQGTFASRAAQKRRNARAERLLVRDAEPWAVIAANLGGVKRAPLLRAAWRELLACHPHDTLCGCSVDTVARAMDARLTEVFVQGRGVRDDALLDVIGHDAVDARERRAEWRSVVVVRNAAARPRSGVAEIIVSSFVEDVAVGPGSGNVSAPVAAAGVARRGVKRSDSGSRAASFALADGEASVEVQLLSESTSIELTESPRHYPDADRVRVSRALAWVEDVPGYGTRSLLDGAKPAPNATEARPRATAGDDWIANDQLRVDWTARGVLRLTTTDGRRITRLVAFEDQQDLGDLYTPSLRGRQRSATFVGARVTLAGPLRAEVETRWRFGDACPMRVRLSLDAGAAWVRLHVDGVNERRDHRLRIIVATGVSAHSDSGDDGGEMWADAAFGPVQRVPLIVPPEDAVAERPLPTAPLHRYVSRFDAERGATLYSDGLAEYEALDDGAIAVTLVRAVGELSRNDLPERPGHAGWPVSVPGAQSLGPFRAMFAVFPHGLRTTEMVDEIERTADDVLLPLRGGSLRPALTVAAPTRGLELIGDGLAFSSCKPSDDGAWTVLRCTNLTDNERAGTWHLGWPITEAHLSRLDETIGDALAVHGDRITFTAPPHAVVTVLTR